MKRFKQVLCASAAMAYVALSPMVAAAQTAPFIIIRFNQQRMYYEQPLYNAISKAVSMKPEVMFDVVAMTPRTGDASKDRAWQERSARNVQEVVNTLNALGVPSSRLNISRGQQSDIRFDEVHISAR